MSDMQAAEKEFQGMWAVVTGGSRGIGRSIALEFARKGANIAILYMPPHEEADETLRMLSDLGVQAEKYHTDVSDYKAVQAAFAKIFQKHGQVDILVNCAGITLDKTMSKMTVDLWQKVIDVNLTGAYNCTKAVWDQMKERKFGRIVSISSVVGQSGNFGQANYAASKAGLLGLTKSLALEGARYGITANAVCPGFINTDMVKAMPAEVIEKIAAKIPVQRLGEPEDVSRAVSFLASPQSDYITGQIIAVNGGFYM
jgi:acetoacetyl-CoA reductase